MDNEKEIDIDLGKIFFMMKKRIIYIILATMICAIVSGCVTEFFITPKYTTSCSMLASNKASINGINTQNPNDITASQQLVKTYIFVLTSDSVLEEVIKALDLDITTNQLKGMITCSQHEETQGFRVYVTSNDPVLSANICNAIADVAPDHVVDKIKTGTISIIDYAKVPSAPSSPNLKKNIVIGAAIGFLVSFIGFFGYELFDTTITSEKDIEREFDIPLLGSIPKLIPAMEKETAANALEDKTAKTKKQKRFSKKGDK